MQFEVHIPMRLQLTGNDLQKRVYALVRSIQGSRGKTCRLSGRDIGRQATHFDAPAIDRSNVNQAVRELIEMRYLVRFDGGIRCCEPDDRGGAFDAYARLGDEDSNVWFGMRYGADQFPEAAKGEVDSTPPEDEGGEVDSTSQLRLDLPRGEVESTSPPYMMNARSINPSKNPRINPPPPDVVPDAARAPEGEPGGGGGVKEFLLEKLERAGVPRCDPSMPWDGERLVEAYTPERIRRGLAEVAYQCSIGAPPHSGGFVVSRIVADRPLSPGARRFVARHRARSGHPAAQPRQPSAGASPPGPPARASPADPPAPGQARASPAAGQETPFTIELLREQLAPQDLDALRERAVESLAPGERSIYWSAPQGLPARSLLHSKMLEIYRAETENAESTR